MKSLTGQRHDRVQTESQHCPTIGEYGGSPIGLAGCGIQHFFAVIFGIRAQNRGGKRELKLRAGAAFRVFKGLGLGVRKGNKVGNRISIPLFTYF